MRRSAFRMFFIIMLLIPLVSVGVPNVYSDGGEPPLPGEHLSGPAIVGTMTLTPINGDPSSVNFIFSGNCKGQPLDLAGTYSPIEVPFPQLEKRNLVDFRLGYIGPQDCRSDIGGEQLIINTVSKFIKSQNQVIADVVILYVLPK